MIFRARAGSESLAWVYVGELSTGRYAEVVESLQPPHPREEKWVLLVSTLDGCPGRCLMCDAGGWYGGRLTSGEILEQIDAVVLRRYPDRAVPARKFKIQFARVGEPALNPAVLTVLKTLPDRYQAPGLMPSVSTVAPAGSEAFFEELLLVKDRLYSGGRFQLQFSVHALDQAERDRLMPLPKWSLEALAAFGRRFFKTGDRKITLNFALGRDSGLPAAPLAAVFDPGVFLIKLTPINPTAAARRNRLQGLIQARPEEAAGVARALRARGFEVLISIGEPEENRIGSNCGQQLRRFLDHGAPGSLPAYTYPLESPILP